MVFGSRRHLLFRVHGGLQQHQQGDVSAFSFLSHLVAFPEVLFLPVLSDGEVLHFLPQRPGGGSIRVSPAHLL